MTVTVFDAHDIYLKTQKQNQRLVNKHIINNTKMTDRDSTEYFIGYPPGETNSNSSGVKLIKYFQLQKEFTSCIKQTRDVKGQI